MKYARFRAWLARFHLSRFSGRRCAARPEVWTFPAGLSDQTTRVEAYQPQLRFFSSPGGVRIMNQAHGLKEQDLCPVDAGRTQRSGDNR